MENPFINVSVLVCSFAAADTDRNHGSNYFQPDWPGRLGIQSELAAQPLRLFLPAGLLQLSDTVNISPAHPTVATLASAHLARQRAFRSFVQLTENTVWCSCSPSQAVKACAGQTHWVGAMTQTRHKDRSYCIRLIFDTYK